MITQIKNKIQKRKEFIGLDRINLNTLTYKPKKNKFKVGMVAGFILFCLITPFTNVLIPLMFKGISKLNPLWMYR